MNMNPGHQTHFLPGVTIFQRLGATLLTPKYICIVYAAVAGVRLGHDSTQILRSHPGVPKTQRCESMLVGARFASLPKESLIALHQTNFPLRPNYLNRLVRQRGEPAFSCAQRPLCKCMKKGAPFQRLRSREPTIHRKKDPVGPTPSLFVGPQKVKQRPHGQGGARGPQFDAVSLLALSSIATALHPRAELIAKLLACGRNWTVRYC